MFLSSKRRVGGKSSHLSREYKSPSSLNVTTKKRRFDNIDGIIATDALNRERYKLAPPKKRKGTKKASKRSPGAKRKKRGKKRLARKKKTKKSKEKNFAKKTIGH